MTDKAKKSSAAALGSTASAKRFFIVAGMPKSGTTFIFSQFSKLTGHFNPPADRKEINYFRGGASFDDYMKFFRTHDDKVYLDASPHYLDEVVQTARNIKAAIGEGQIKILVCIRDPFERIFSHYLHDLAQGYSIVSHADYSFLSPLVLAKYLYPLAARIRHIQAEFGAENVHGFSFAADNAAFRDDIVKFARLPGDWDFNFSHNPAPGFTAPQAFYNAEIDTTVAIKGKVYRLPAGHLLVINRQFSLYRPTIARQVGEQIVQRQSSHTRSFDTGVLSQASRDLVLDDFRETCGLLNLDIPVEPHPRVLHSQVSDDLPDEILAQLDCVDTLDGAVARLFADPLRDSADATMACPPQGPSLAKAMAAYKLALKRRDPGGLTSGEARDEIVNTFGPIPYYIGGTLRSLLSQNRIDEIEALFAPFGGAQGLLVKIDAARHLQARGIELSEEAHQRLRKIGVRTRLPKAAG